MKSAPAPFPNLPRGCEIRTIRRRRDKHVNGIIGQEKAAFSTTAHAAAFSTTAHALETCHDNRTEYTEDDQHSIDQRSRAVSDGVSVGSVQGPGRSEWCAPVVTERTAGDVV